jgi:lipopolysaccharide export LptBFGC system permease protein LptF
VKKNILDTERDYYVFVNGENEYNEYIDNKLSLEADNIINRYKDKINNYKTNNEKLLDEINLINENGENTYDLYNEYKKDNNLVKNKYNTYKSDVFTNFRKSYYQTNEYEKILKKYNYYFIFYYLFCFIYIFLLFVFGFKKNSFKNIILFIIFVLLQPFLIYIFVEICLIIFFYLKNFLTAYTPNTDFTNLLLTQSRNVIYNNTI